MAASGGQPAASNNVEWTWYAITVPSKGYVGLVGLVPSRLTGIAGWLFAISVALRVCTLAACNQHGPEGVHAHGRSQIVETTGLGPCFVLV